MSRVALTCFGCSGANFSRFVGSIATLLLLGVAPVSLALTAQTITFAALSGKTYGNAPFTVSATASSGLAISFSSLTTSVCTVSATTVTLVAAGTCTVRASQAGNATYAAAPNVDRSFTVAKAAQSITFAALAGRRLDQTPFTVTATASSGLAVTFSSTTTSICTVSVNTVTLKAVGTCTIRAAQAGDANYNAATTVSQSLTVSKGNQTITFGALSGQRLDQTPVAVAATASSTLAVSFSSLTTTICTVAGTSVALKAVGTCTVRAAQAGNANWNAAANVDQSVTVAKGNQTISFAAIAARRLDQTPMTLTATASSALAVTFSSLTTTVCTVSGTTLTLKTLGTCTVRAAQAGNTDWNAAANVDQSFSVTKGTQTITFNAPPNKTIGAAPFSVSATATSGLAVTFASLTTATCTVSGTTVTLVASGTCSLRASQAGNASWDPAVDVDRSFTIAKATQTLTFAALPAVAWGDPPIALSATASSGLPVAFVSQSPAVCSVTGSTATIIGVGTCTVLASQAGDSRYNAAPSVARSFPVIGPVTFAPATDYPLASPGHLALGDATSDGRIDVVAASGTNVTVLSGMGNGTLGTPTTLAVGNNLGRVAIADINGDGRPDLLILDWYQSTVTLYFRSASSYSAPVTLTVADSPTAIAVADLNGDGKADLVVANGYVAGARVVGNTIQVFVGNGDGTFQAPVAYRIGDYAQALVLGDFNGDGKVDVAAAGFFGSVSVLNGNGDGTLATPVGYPTLLYPSSLAVADLDGDGKLDLVVGYQDMPGELNPGLSTLRNLGNGTFAARVDLPVDLGSGLWSVAVADFNGDGRPDIAAVARNDTYVGVYRGVGDGTFLPALSVNVGVPGYALAAADLNGDGQPDLVETSQVSNVVRVLINAQAGSSSTIAVQAGSPQSANINAAYAVALQALVRSSGGQPLAGQDVLFTAPSAGPSGTFSGGVPSAQVTTNAAGIATAPTFTANATAGSFSVIASAGALSTSFALTNVGGSSQAPTFVSPPPPGGTINVPYSYQVIASGTPAPTYSTLPNALPTGLFINGNTGLLSGTPTAAATYSGTITAANGVLPNASQTFAITIALNAQSITFDPLANRTIGDPAFTLSASATSGLPVSFASTTATICTVTSNTVTLVAAGTCTIQATQAGNGTYGPATAVNRSFTVSKKAQSITFGPLYDQFLGTGPVALSATASSGLTVTFTSLTASICTVSGSTATLVAAGTCTVRAAQAGNATFAAAPTNDQSFQVKPAGTNLPPTVSLIAPTNGSTFVAPAIVPLRATVSDGDGSVSRVEFYSGSTLVGTTTASPHQFVWRGVVAGTYTLTAKAYDNNGAATTSTAISITVAATGSPLRLGDYDLQPMAGGDVWVLTVGDFNADGKPDIATATQNLQNLLLGGGNGGFDALASFAGSAWCSGYDSLVSGDFNGDGKLDIAMASLSGCTDVVLGRGDGRFDPAPRVGTTNASELVAIDLNGDGKLDLVLANADGSLSLHIGVGNGTFAASNALSVGTALVSVVAADFTGDGKVDLLALQSQDNTLFLLAGAGNGTFGSPVAIPLTTTGVPESLAVGDFNGDGKKDVAVATDGQVGVLLGNGDGTFQPLVEYPSGDTVTRLAVADLNGDGKLDLVTANGQPIGSVIVLLGNGNGTFRAPLGFNSGPVPRHVALVDVNNDGLLDVLTNGPYGVSVLLNLTGLSTAAPQITSGVPPDGIAGDPYSFQFTASGTPAPTFSFTPPPGTRFHFTSGGQVRSDAAEYGTFPIRVTATNGFPPDATQDVVILIRKRPQTIDFQAPSEGVYPPSCDSGLCAPWFPQASAISGLPVTIASITPSVCGTDANGYFEPRSVGTCVMRAEQPGDNLYWAAAPPIDRSIQIGPPTPSIQIVTPVDRSGFVAPASIALTAAANPYLSFPLISVEYFRDGVLIGSATTAPFAVTWSNVPAGTYSVTAKKTHRNMATGGLYEFTSPAITVIVGSSPDQPAASLTGPSANSSYVAPATVALTASASNASGTIARVDFYSGAFIVGSSTTPPYAYTWNGVAPGTYTLTARATSGNGVVATSSPVTITVNTDLSDAIASYPFNTTWAGVAPVPDIISRYDGTRLGSVTQVPAPTLGSKPDTGMAASFAGGVIDVSGLPMATSSGSKASVAFWMKWNGVDNAVPVSWSSQGLLLASGGFGFTTFNGDVYGVASTGLANGWHHVVAEFSNGSVTSNRLVIDGVQQTLTQRVGTPLSANAVVSAVFRMGGRAGSANQRFGGELDEVQIFGGALLPAHINVLMATASSSAPLTVTLAEPVNGSTFRAPANLDLVAGAYYVAGLNGNVIRVDFFGGTTLIGTSYGPRPHRIRWSNAPAGTYTLTAVARASSGESVTSVPATITVTEVSGNSSLGLGYPTQGTQYYTSGPIHLRLNVTPAPSYSILRVEWSANGALIGTDSEAPYTLRWNFPVPGTYTVVARAIDNAGFASSTAPITITVVDTQPNVVYYYNDAAGTPVAAADEFGTLIWDETYTPYGNRYEKEDGQTQNGLWYTGKPTEDATGLSYLGARWYNPQIGRFYSADPVGFKDASPLSFNRYAYGNNNPYRYVDPDGRFPFLLVAWGIGAAWTAYDTYQTYQAEGAVAAAETLAFDFAVTASLGVAGKAFSALRHAEQAARGAGHATTEFIDGVSVVSRGKVIGRGTVDVRATVEGIQSGRLSPKDIFRNDQGLLPKQGPRYYQEFVHPTPGVSGAGPQRIIRGQGGELYYTPDHYGSFIPLN